MRCRGTGGGTSGWIGVQTGTSVSVMVVWSCPWQWAGESSNGEKEKGSVVFVHYSTRLSSTRSYSISTHSLTFYGSNTTRLSHYYSLERSYVNLLNTTPILNSTNHKSLFHRRDLHLSRSPSSPSSHPYHVSSTNTSRNTANEVSLILFLVPDPPLTTILNRRRAAALVPKDENKSGTASSNTMMRLYTNDETPGLQV